MGRATWILAATTIAGAVISVRLYLDGRALRAELAASRRTPVATSAAPEAPAGAATDPWLSSGAPRAAATTSGATPRPSLPAPQKESRLDRRNRRQKEIAAMFGRLEGETEEEYRARVAPMIKTALALPRQRVEDLRRDVEARAHVTAEQSRKLDRAFDKVYDEVLDYTNKAVADGQVSPYERNVSGWLEYAGGLGAILEDAQGQVGQILSPDQVQTISDTGFEWGEYLGVQAPWEQLTPPPPPSP